MNKYVVRFITKDEDYESAWCYANSKDEAEKFIKDDYWNIDYIVSIECR